MKVRFDAGLRRTVVIGRNDKDRVHTCAGSCGGEFGGMTSVIRARSGDKWNIDRRAHRAPQRDLFVVGETGGLASRAAQNKCIVALRDKPTGQLGRAFMIEFAIGGEWGDHCGDHRTET